MLNQCKYGQDCQFTHGLACEKCHKNVFNPLLPIQNQILEHKQFCISNNRENTVTTSECVLDGDERNNDTNNNKENGLLNPKAKEFKFEIDDENNGDTGCHHKSLSENVVDNQFPVVECGICYEKITVTGRTLGLLANCNHVFCYNCIKKWRSTVLNLYSVKSCPLCRKISFYIIPSSIYPKNEEEKNLIISEYRKSRMKILCKYYKYPEHQFCPFGDECFYAHKLPNGERAVLGPPHVQLEYRSSQSTDLHYISQSEEWWNSEVLRQIREIIESSSFDDHDIQTLLSTLSQIILISEGGRAFREPDTILHIRHTNNTNHHRNSTNNGHSHGQSNGHGHGHSHGQGNSSSSDVIVSVESSSSYHPSSSSSSSSSPLSINSSPSQSTSYSPLSTRTSSSNPSPPTTTSASPSPHGPCHCPCHQHDHSTQTRTNPLLSNLSHTISAINQATDTDKEAIEKEDFKSIKK